MPPGEDPPSPDRDTPVPAAAVSSPTLKDDAPVDDEAPVTPRTPSAPPPPPAPPAVTDADLRAYLSSKDTQRHLRNVVAGALGWRATRDLVGEIAGETQVAILDGQTRPESLEKMPGWVDGVARHMVSAHFEGEKEERKVFSDRHIVGEGHGGAGGGALDAYDGSHDHDAADGAHARAASHAADGVDAPADAADDSSEPTPDTFLMSSWLRSRARKDPDERELLDLITYKARTKKTYAVIAAERGTTVTAINNRVYRLRKKYEPEWQDYKRRRDTMLLLWLKAAKVAGVVVFAAFVGFLVWLLLRPRVDEARPVDDLPELKPAPTASAEPPPDIADPTHADPPQPYQPKVVFPPAGAAAGKGNGKGTAGAASGAKGTPSPPAH